MPFNGSDSQDGFVSQSTDKLSRNGVSWRTDKEIAESLSVRKGGGRGRRHTLQFNEWFGRWKNIAPKCNNGQAKRRASRRRPSELASAVRRGFGDALGGRRFPIVKAASNHGYRLSTRRRRTSRRIMIARDIQQDWVAAGDSKSERQEYDEVQACDLRATGLDRSQICAGRTERSPAAPMTGASAQPAPQFH